MSERIKVIVIDRENNIEKELFHDREQALLYTLREGGIILPSLCGSMGKCGKCQVRFCGYAPFPGQTDRAVISPDKLREGYRLACTACPGKDCVIETAFEKERGIDVVVESRTEDVLREGSLREKEDRDKDGGCGKGQQDVLPEKEKAKGLAAAVDIGTTTIAVQMIEAWTGHILDTYVCLNPQGSYGMDVISRIQAGTEGHGEELRRLVREALEAGIRRMAENPGDGKQRKLEKIVIAANTAMGHLFMGYPVESLGKSPFRPVNIGAVQTDFLGTPAALIPGISAFVGGDIISGLYACGLCRQTNRVWLFLDLGTNAEMVIGDGRRLACTAAAAGPAFEGKGRYGATGAERISAIAYLLEQGLIDKTGLLREPYFETGIETEIEKPGKKVWVFEEDIRDIQMAKAAIRAGIYFLMEHLGIKGLEEVEKVYIAGGLGFYLDKKAASRIGLIPAEWLEKIETMGNTALAGARLLARELCKEDYRAGSGMEVMNCLEKAALKAESFQLAEEASFEKIYIDYMNFGD